MVYFIQDSVQKFIKIGKTGNLQARMFALQNGNPSLLVCLAVIEHEDDDWAYQHRFKRAHHAGEWYRPTPELLAFIESIPDGGYTGMISNASVKYHRADVLHA